jgi:hypothetical protein
MSFSDSSSAPISPNSALKLVLREWLIHAGHVASKSGGTSAVRAPCWDSLSTHRCNEFRTSHAQHAMISQPQYGEVVPRVQ